MKFELKLNQSPPSASGWREKYRIRRLNAKNVFWKTEKIFVLKINVIKYGFHENLCYVFEIHRIRYSDCFVNYWCIYFSDLQVSCFVQPMTPSPLILLRFQSLFASLLHYTKKSRFQLRISSVNAAKSAVSCGSGHIYCRNP